MKFYLSDLIWPPMTLNILYWPFNRNFKVTFVKEGKNRWSFWAYRLGLFQLCFVDTLSIKITISVNNPIYDNYIGAVKSKIAQIQTKFDEIQTIKDEKCPEKEVI